MAGTASAGDVSPLETPTEHPKGGFPREGTLFPLTKVSKVKANWAKLFRCLGIMRATMIAIGVAKDDGSKPGPEMVLQDVLNNLYTAVLTTVYVSGLSIIWANPVAMIIINCYYDCEELALLASEGGLGCNAECAFIDIILRSLWFERKAIVAQCDASTVDILSWCWAVKRTGARSLTVTLWEYKKLVGITAHKLQNHGEEQFRPAPL